MIIRLDRKVSSFSFSTPYIDFHYGNSAADYTHRIIADDPVALGFECSIRVSKNIRAQEGIKADKYVRAASRAGLIAQYDSDPGGNIGDIRVAPILCSQFATVGSDGNGNAGANFGLRNTQVTTTVSLPKSRGMVHPYNTGIIAATE
ncbi:hypothetical protein LNO78_29100 [Klebsiella pneumoniae subsp. pneumoniae]|nr:hypothetical protein [Klebsiella pneumoniae subsp. pneumoniae]